jgi:hypothetical protein
VDGDRIVVSNSCGYDTALFEVREVLVGTYATKDLAAYQLLGEWCEGAWQKAVRDYFVFLRWNGVVWKVDTSLSSPLMKGNGRELWLVEPAALSRLRELHAPEAELVKISHGARVALTNERLEQMGVHSVAGTTPAESAQQALLTCKTEWCWSSAPMLFARGIALGDMRKYLAAFGQPRTPSQAGH